MLFILEEETKLSTISLCFHLTLFHDPGCIHQFVDFFILLFICDILYCLLFYCHSVYFNLLCLDLISTIPEIQCYIDAIVSRCLLRFFSPFYSILWFIEECWNTQTFVHFYFIGHFCCFLHFENRLLLY